MLHTLRPVGKERHALGSEATLLSGRGGGQEDRLKVYELQGWATLVVFSSVTDDTHSFLFLAHSRQLFLL